MTTKLNVKKQGPLNAPPLLVLHGWGMDSSVWKAIAIPFERHFRVTWLDLPGYGENYAVRADTLSEIVALILPLITRATHIMGWSLGGLIAQEMIRQQPHLIKRVVMVASTPRFSQSERWHHAMSKEVLDTFSKHLINDTKKTIKRFIALQFMHTKNSQRIQRTLREHILNSIMNRKTLTVGLHILQQQDFLDMKMAQQQLWLLGGKDLLIPIEMKNDLRILYPNATIETINEAGHAPFMTHPQVFIDIVLPFLLKEKQARR